MHLPNPSEHNSTNAQDLKEISTGNLRFWSNSHRQILPHRTTTPSLSPERSQPAEITSFHCTNPSQLSLSVLAMKPTGDGKFQSYSPTFTLRSASPLSSPEHPNSGHSLHWRTVNPHRKVAISGQTKVRDSALGRSLYTLQILRKSE